MALRSSLLSVLVVAALCTFEVGAQDIEVRLLDLASPRQVALAPVGGDVQLFAGDFDDPLATLSGKHEAIVSRASNQLHVKIGEMGLYANSLRVEPMEEAQFDLEVREGRTLVDARTYPGRLFISPDAGDWQLRLVNEVNLEDYVASVVSSEYGFDDLEGSKAMAVIARTYALAALQDSEGDLTDHTLSQVYQGSGGVSEVARQAARETAGEVVTHDGSLIQAVYFSSSGGHTADNESVWSGRPQPYLRGKPDPYGSASPHSEWTSRVSRTELLRKLSQAYRVSVEGFVVDDRSDDGRVASVELLLDGDDRLRISANEFRLHVIEQFGPRSLRSTLFDARRDGDKYVFEGRGYGHGVGLSQWGAREMAQRGSTYTDILSFYYTGVQVASVDGAEPVTPPIRKVSTRPEPPERTKSSTRIGW